MQSESLSQFSTVDYFTLLGWHFIENGRHNLRVAVSQSSPTMNSQLQVTPESWKLGGRIWYQKMFPNDVMRGHKEKSNCSAEIRNHQD